MKKSAASGRGIALKVTFNQQRLFAIEYLLENVKKKNIHTYEEKKKIHSYHKASRDPTLPRRNESLIFSISSIL